MFSLAPLGERGDRKAGGEGVRLSVQARGPADRKRQNLDPLTRLAPADEIADGETPSPSRGRGLVSLTPATESQIDGLMLRMPKMHARSRMTWSGFFRILLENHESAIRKCDRKEMQITMKSEAIAKVYVIENEVVRE